MELKTNEIQRGNISIVPVSHIHLYPKVNFPADKKNKQTNKQQ